MQPVIIKQITEEEIHQQRELINCLEAAILIENLTILSDLLDPRGIYFEKMSRDQAIIYLIKKFNKVKRNQGRVNIDINHGFSFDHFPNQYELEFRFSIGSSKCSLCPHETFSLFARNLGKTFRWQRDLQN